MEISLPPFALFLFISNYFSLISSKSFLNLTTDQQALLAFKNSVTDPNAILLNNWTVNTLTCRWTGVSCGPKHQRVTSLNLSGFELLGTLSPHIGNLTFLRSLDISSNNFTGFLPSELSKLRRLQEIDVSINEFTGEIPSSFGELTQLRGMFLYDNAFSGRIPSSLFNISSLIQINLGDNELSGKLPNNICSNIVGLKAFSVYYNQLEGEILPSICSCRDLRILQLQKNQFNGNIPIEIGSLSKLDYMLIWENQFEGGIPNQIGNLTSLTRINLESNNIIGNIPKQVGNLTNLKELNFGGNKLTGGMITTKSPKGRAMQPSDSRGGEQSNTGATMVVAAGDVTQELNCAMDIRTGEIIGCDSERRGLYYVDEIARSGTVMLAQGSSDREAWLWHRRLGELVQELANLAFLEDFSVFNNSLSGSIPQYMFNISTLYLLELSFNEFCGSLPQHRGLSLPNLEVISLSKNNLSGPIPSYITNASLLTHLEMSTNAFVGVMPNFGSLRYLETLRIWDNHLRGEKSPTQELQFLSSLTNCRNLEDLEVARNQLNGIVPKSVGNLSTSLLYFIAYDANITGVIPSEVGNLSLELLSLERNQLTGLIPSTMGKLRRLQVLSLYGNQLQGSIPVDLCKLNNLGDLFLDRNLLTGPLPECFGGMKTLRNIGLSSNMFNSSLPSTFWNLRDLITLNLSSNVFSGQLSPQISQLEVVTKMDMSSNKFSGEIPATIDGCESLDILNFSNNKFVGSIPPSLGNARGLTTIDLSNNSLFGSIPKSLEKLRFLEYFNVSYNNLEGEIPNGGHFVNFSAQSFTQNYNLCGASRFQVPPCAKNHGTSRSESVFLLMRYILPVFFLVVIFVGVIIILIRRCKQTKVLTPIDHTSLGTTWRVISYIELERATNYFSETEILGRGSFGSVFKGTLSDGINIAVKVFNIQSDRANESFATESRILSTIRHRNLVRIISSCTNMEFKALILEFMPNGSLEKWLYSDHHCTDLLPLLNIAIDVSLAIEHLHHGDTFPVVHCDIKPSNVLLDEDMTARVADFGIAKLFDEGEDMIRTKTLATIGYAAPEYGSQGKVSTCTDVYSYGIMLLEIFTRKKPTDDMFNEEMSLKDWVISAIQANSIHEILTPGLLFEEDRHFAAKEQCVTCVFDLAMKCVAFSSEERMNMIEVVAALQKIKAKVVAVINARHQHHAISIP